MLLMKHICEQKEAGNALFGKTTAESFLFSSLTLGHFRTLLRGNDLKYSLHPFSFASPRPGRGTKHSLCHFSGPVFDRGRGQRAAEREEHDPELTTKFC